MWCSSRELTHWPSWLGFGACFCHDLQFQIARSEVSLEDSHQPPLYLHNSSFKVCIASGAMGVSTRIASGIVGLGSGRAWVRCEDKSSAKSRAGNGGTGPAMLCSPFQIMTPDPFAVLE